jgi:DNA-directed RNA polymerase omega subunit
VNKVKALTNSVDVIRASDRVGNKFDMVLIAAARARELKRGYARQVNTDNGPIVTALQEIEAGLVGRDYLKKVRTPLAKNK